MKVLDLAGRWQVAPVAAFPARPQGLADWREMQVPSHWQQHPDLARHAGKVVYCRAFSFHAKKTLQSIKKKILCH